MKKTILYIILISVLHGCISNKSTSRYDEAPGKNELLEALNRVMPYSIKVYAAATYKTINFDADMQYTNADLSTIQFQDFESESSTESSMATATMIKSNQNQNILLTCYHIFNYPDTVRQYYYRSDGTRTAFLRSISVKTSQKNFTKQSGKNHDLNLIASDENLDVAILTFENPDQNSIPFSIETIEAESVKTGETVFVPGFPSGYKMVTKATVSKPNRHKPETIMLDANFNRGFSGAPFYVYSARMEKMLLGGIVTTAASETKNVLTPKYQSHQKIYDPAEPYKDAMYVERDERVKYGITFTLTTEKLNDFYIQEKARFEEKSINLDPVFN